ncbi:MAG: hypothetical protein ACYCXW_04265 [Solirubrobacteraceae bacterium]
MATVILALISMLLIVLGGLLDGLTASNTGALRAQRGELIVYSSDAEDSLVRSRITPAVRVQVQRAAGAASPTTPTASRQSSTVTSPTRARDPSRAWMWPVLAL